MNQSFSPNKKQNNFAYESAEALHEPVEVEAQFSRVFLGHCRPISFRRQSGRETQITEIGLIHPRYDGLKTTFAFDISDGVSDYRLVFDSESLNWYLDFEGDEFTSYAEGSQQGEFL